MAAKAGTVALVASIIGTGALAIALVSGLLYERAGRVRDREQFPRVGRPVDIGGRMLNIDCAGTGQPAIILESGAPLAFYTQPKQIWENGMPHPGYSWVGIQRQLAKFTTTCWYDRAGTGWSDPGPYPRDSAAQARDLHALLGGAGVPPPYVLVSESSAALEARVYTELYPLEVAGLALVDGVHPDLLLRTRARAARIPRFVYHSQDVMARVFYEVGMLRLGSGNRPAPAPPQGITPAEWRMIWHLNHAAKARSALMEDIAAWEQSAIQARGAGSLGDRPLIVVSSENREVAPKDPGLWMELERDLAALSTSGKSIMLAESGGDLIYRAPEPIIEASREVVSDVRQQPASRR